MFSITEILIIQFLCLIIVFNSKSVKKTFPFFYENINEKMNEFINIIKIFHENNPLLLDYYDKPDELFILKDEYQEEDNNKKELKPEVKYENKYLAKYKSFPNKYCFTEDELSEENKEYEKIKEKYKIDRFNTINAFQEQLHKINNIQEKGNIENDCKNINEFGINSLFKYFEIDNLDEDIIEELYNNLLKNKEELLKKIDASKSL